MAALFWSVDTVFPVERGEEEPRKQYRSDRHVAHVANRHPMVVFLFRHFFGSTPSLRRDQFHLPRY